MFCRWVGYISLSDTTAFVYKSAYVVSAICIIRRSKLEMLFRLVLGLESASFHLFARWGRFRMLKACWTLQAWLQSCKGVCGLATLSLGFQYH